MHTLLERAPFHQWVWSSVITELPQAITAFPGGLSDVLEALAKRIDTHVDFFPLEENLSQGQKSEALIVSTLRFLGPYQQSLRLFFAHKEVLMLSMPWVYKRADHLWYRMGDTALDVSFYTKRLTLGGIYGTVFARWLYDSSPDFLETIALLTKQLQLCKAIGNFKKHMFS